MTSWLMSVVAGLTLAIPGATPNVSGDWNLSLKADWTKIPALACTLAQNGQDITGSCSAAADPDERRVQITNGRVTEDRIEFGWTLDTPDGETWTYTLTGTVDAKAGAMKGGFKISGRAGGGEGTFSASKRAG